jgi:hypothetical protein
MLPFSRYEFFGVFAAYNAATWPAAIVAYVLAIAALLFACRATQKSSHVVAAILALMWGWVGVMYHGAYFSQINPVARVFAAAFVLQALLFVLNAVRDSGLEFGPRSRVRTAAGAIMIVYALIAYPLIGLAVGETYSAMPLFGVTPCPLLIFTFALMLWATRARWWLWIVPIMWSVVGGSAALLLSVPQDWALPFFAVTGLILILTDQAHSRQTSS